MTPARDGAEPSGESVPPCGSGGPARVATEEPDTGKIGGHDRGRQFQVLR